jgi:hypothetical protein
MRIQNSSSWVSYVISWIAYTYFPFAMIQCVVSCGSYNGVWVLKWSEDSGICRPSTGYEVVGLLGLLLLHVCEGLLISVKNVGP